ncbi:hypothetical protein EYF80_019655 [Liparis tanakae]|uniref:Uncharacterized protein n=1 Tax=Liparis tanakae TaxID=230148 RepID=A0A4Z2HYS8_9TELE|nr:hypothetical protein EYF80_019655 [Liparis tanakae]
MRNVLAACNPTLTYHHVIEFTTRDMKRHEHESRIRSPFAFWSPPTEEKIFIFHNQWLRRSLPRVFEGNQAKLDRRSDASTSVCRGSQLWVVFPVSSAWCW